MHAIINLLIVGGALYIGWRILNEMGTDTGGV